MTEKQTLAFWLQHISQLTNQTKFLLQECFVSLNELTQAGEKQLRSLGYLTDENIYFLKKAQQELDLEVIREEMKRKSISYSPWDSQLYPEKLLEIHDPPLGLFFKGRMPSSGGYSVGVVGARKCTAYGESHALRLGEKLGKAGVKVISGLALGIDGFAHRGALKGGGETFAVLGCGLDICYPRANIGLFQDILESGGGIISEHPVGTPPLAFHFPLRNRIISGLSRALIIIEAKEKSGSLITADLALEQGKDVYALPGPVDSSYSRGCHQLIRQGAGIIISPEILMEDLGILSNESLVNEKKVLDSSENIVYSLLCLNPKGVDELLSDAKMEVAKLMQTLISLELKGYIKEISKHNYVRL